MPGLYGIFSYGNRQGLNNKGEGDGNHQIKNVVKSEALV